MEEYKGAKKLNIEWHSLVRDLIHNAWLVVLAAIIGLIAVFVAGKIVYKPVYTSTATLIVNVKTGTYQTYTNLGASSEMATIFSEVFVQPSMKQKAAEFLGKDRFTGELRTYVLTNTNIITLKVTSEDPELAYEELSAVLTVYPEISDTIFANAVLDVMRAPEVPKGPSNHMPNSFKTAAVAGCVMLTLLAIAILSILRDTVKSESAYTEKVGSKLIGTVIHERTYHTLNDMLKRQKSRLLIDNAFVSFRFSESYQKIASRFEYFNRNDGDKVFLVTSVAENEGKSTVAINTAIALAGRGKKVALVDMDFMKPAVNKYLKVETTEDDDIGRYISQSLDISKLELRQYKSSRLYLAVNSRRYSDYVNWINSGYVKELIGKLKEDYDYVIVDTSPISVAAEVVSLARICDKSILIVRTDYVQTADINDAVMMLADNKQFAGCILNDVFDEFSLFGQLGTDETGVSGGRYSGSYGGYSNYVSAYAATLGMTNNDNENN
ncbi:MAG: AAA family ATPase [Clostridia bacterium]|nr:AAA family ATPase [Clostridia bacterium]